MVSSSRALPSTFLLLLLLFLLPCLGLTACSEQAVEPDPPLDPFVERRIAPELQGDVDAVVRAHNAFALELYDAVRQTPTNLVLSPYSVYEALAMTSAGAAGVTESEMLDVLEWEGERLAFHEACGALLQSLDRGGELGGYTIEIANRLWGQEGYGFLEDFLGLIREKHDAPLEELDFIADPESCRQTINAWVEQATHDRIVDLLPPGTVDATTRLVLTNAIWFEGTWLWTFDPDRTEATPFHVGPDRTVSVEMMSASGEFPLGHHDGVQALRLPYQGEDLSMLFLLPDPGESLDAVEARLSVEWIDALVATIVDDVECDLFVPRFEFEAEFPLVPVLASLGMPSAFGGPDTDFSRMNGQRNLAITEVRHKAFVKVDEEGTEAAAATGVVVGETSLPPTFRADRPFLFLIRDHVTGAILFMGRVLDPA